MFREQSAFQFEPEILTMHDNVVLNGYWQFEDYFRDQEKIIREELIFKYPLSNSSQIWANQIRDDPMPVSLHIRRGDYMSGWAYKTFNHLPLKFYERCVGILKENFPEMTLYIFSDDLIWCRKFLSFSVPMYFVDSNDESHGYDDLCLMSLCRHHIIANSTFSFWGAWLDNRAGSLVFAPRRFAKTYNPIHESRRIPARWIVFDD